MHTISLTNQPSSEVIIGQVGYVQGTAAFNLTISLTAEIYFQLEMFHVNKTLPLSVKLHFGSPCHLLCSLLILGVDESVHLPLKYAGSILPPFRIDTQLVPTDNPLRDHFLRYPFAINLLLTVLELQFKLDPPSEIRRLLLRLSGW